MVVFSFYVFVTHLLCIIYLMNSGEDFVKNFAKSAGMTHMLLKIQFFIMAMCYVGLAYSCVAQGDLYDYILAIVKKSVTPLDYTLAVTLYVIIHLLWCTHFIDLVVRAHIFTHSKKGHYESAITRLLQKLCGLLSLQSKKQ